MKKEIWKDIKGYEDLYEVSNLGRVKSLEKEIWNGKGYYIKKEYYKKITFCAPVPYGQLNLNKNGKQKMHYIHRLVAQAFIPNPENKKEVNHKDGNKSNNLSENLEWVTRLENIEHSINVLGNRQDGRFNNNTKLNEFDIKKIRKDKRKHAEIANQYNVSRTCITMIKNYKNWQHIK